MTTETETLLTFLHSVYVPSRLELSATATQQIDVAVRLFERWVGRPLSISDFSENLVRRFLADYRRTHAAASTNSKRGHLLALWRCAFDEGLLDSPPRYAKIRKAKAEGKVPKAWTPAEVGRIIKSARQDPKPIAGLPAADWWESLLLVLYDSGARLGEALKVESDALELEHSSIVFRHTKTRRERWAALHADTIAACRRIHDPDRPLMWPWPWTRKAMNDRFKKILARAGIRWRSGVLFRVFRRTSGTLVEANGGDGAKHLGNTRAVFEKHYRDPRFFSSDLDLLPRPR